MSSDEARVALQPQDLGRREFIRRSAVVGGLVWAAPVVTRFGSPAFAGTPLGEGCTPGFWRNQPPEGWPSPYPPNTLFSDVFQGSIAGKSTLLDVLAPPSGDPTGQFNFGFHAVGALLNAAHPDVDFPLTVAQVKTRANEALAAGTTAAFNEAASEFAALNTADCPLERTRAA